MGETWKCGGMLCREGECMSRAEDRIYMCEWEGNRCNGEDARSRGNEGGGRVQGERHNMLVRSVNVWFRQSCTTKRWEMLTLSLGVIRDTIRNESVSSDKVRDTQGWIFEEEGWWVCCTQDECLHSKCL